MMKNKIYLLLTLLISLTLSCQKFSLDPKKQPWSSEWLVPVLKTSFSLENLKSLQNSTVSFPLAPIDIGVPNIGFPINLPPIYVRHIGPFAQPVADWLYKANLDSLRLSVTMQNIFPVIIDSSTKVVFRNDPDTNNLGNILYSTVIGHDIMPNETFTVDLNVYKKSIEDTLYLYLDDFNSPGGNNITFNPQPSIITSTINVIDVASMEIKTNHGFRFTDTLPTSFLLGQGVNTGSGQSVDLKGLDSIATGLVHAYVDNGMSLNLDMQVYILDANYIKIDSFFNKRANIVGGSNNINSGDPVHISTTDNPINLDKTKLGHLSQGSYYLFDFGMNTNSYPGSHIKLSRNAKMELQLVGDVKIQKH